MRIVKDTSQEQSLIEAYLSAKAAADRAQERVAELAERLCKEMEATQTKTYTTDDAKVTYVRNSTTKIDEKGLRRALRAKVFDRYTVRKLDRRAMEAAMDTGEVDPVIVSKFVHTEYTKPYLRVSAPEEK